MRVDLTLQLKYDQTLPVMPVKASANRPLALEFTGIPERVLAPPVTAVKIRLVNADMEPIEVGAAQGPDGGWGALFAPSCFRSWGYVALGFQATLLSGVETLATVMGGLDIRSSEPSVSPGKAAEVYQLAGGDVYKKSKLVGTVQHYVKEELVFDAEIGWGLTWTGDYIKNGGEFVPVESEVAE